MLETFKQISNYCFAGIGVLAFIGIVLALASYGRARLLVWMLGRRRCPFCGAAYGYAAAVQAKTAYRVARQQAIWSGNIEAIENLPKEWPALCPQCRRQGIFDERSGAVHPAEYTAERGES